jgi:hypothetical protein
MRRPKAVAPARFPGLVVRARAKHPIPSRTRPLSAAAPMVLRPKTRESRSPPNLKSARTRRPPLRSPHATIPAAGWSSPVARQAHNLKVVGSNPTPATKSPYHINAPRASARGVLSYALPRELVTGTRRGWRAGSVFRSVERSSRDRWKGDIWTRRFSRTHNQAEAGDHPAERDDRPPLSWDSGAADLHLSFPPPAGVHVSGVSESFQLRNVVAGERHAGSSDQTLTYWGLVTPRSGSCPWR